MNAARLSPAIENSMRGDVPPYQHGGEKNAMGLKPVWTLKVICEYGARVYGGRVKGCDHHRKLQ